MDTPEDVLKAAVEKGFDAIGFSSHALLPISDPWTLQPDTVAAYVADVRALAEKYKGTIRVLCGIEADFISGLVRSDRSVYAPFHLDYLIGSIHEVVADGVRIPVDHKPELLAEAGLAKKVVDGIKILGNGSLDKALTVKAQKFTKSCVTSTNRPTGTTRSCASPQTPSLTPGRSWR